MITRRKLFGLVAGAVVAPKELLAAPVATPMFQFGFAEFKNMPVIPDYIWAYPATFDDCFGEITIRSPRMSFVLTGIQAPEPDKEEA